VTEQVDQGAISRPGEQGAAKGVPEVGGFRVSGDGGKGGLPEESVPKGEGPGCKVMAARGGVPEDGVLEGGVPEVAVPRGGVRCEEGVPEESAQEGGAPEGSVHEGGGGVPEGNISRGVCRKGCG